MTTLYTVQLGHGLGVVDETYLLLRLWQEGMNGPERGPYSLQAGQFPTLSARRLHDLVTVGFAQRYLIEDGRPAKTLALLAPVLSRGEFEQLLFIYTCRVHAVLTDFVCQVYWDAYTSGRPVLTNEEARAFIVRAVR